MTLHGKRVLAEMSMVKDLKMRSLGWALHALVSALLRSTGRVTDM